LMTRPVTELMSIVPFKIISAVTSMDVSLAMAADSSASVVTTVRRREATVIVNSRAIFCVVLAGCGGTTFVVPRRRLSG
jgi:hypothetical protein